MVDRKKETGQRGRGEGLPARGGGSSSTPIRPIAEVAVVPQPDPKLGEIPVAVVALKQGAALSEEELTGFLADKLARFKVPRRVVFVESLPRNPIGKIVKKEIVRMLAEEGAS